jgi:hypothetical protein
MANAGLAQFKTLIVWFGCEQLAYEIENAD